MPYTVTGPEDCLLAVYVSENIILDMPLRMTAGTFNDVAGIRIMPQFSQLDGNCLGFFTSNKNFHMLHLLLKRQCRVIALDSVE